MRTEKLPVYNCDHREFYCWCPANDLSLSGGNWVIRSTQTPVISQKKPQTSDWVIGPLSVIRDKNVNQLFYPIGRWKGVAGFREGFII